MRCQVRYPILPVLVALIAVAACVPIPEPDQTIAASTGTVQPVAPTRPAQPSENIAGLGSARGSTENEEGHIRIDTESAYRAIDGDVDSVWSSQKHPTQWFAVAFDDLYLIDAVEMVVAQVPAGPTTHEVWVGNGSGTRTLHKRLAEVHSEDGQTLRVTIDPPRIAKEVLVLTVHSPSWVAWREVRVFGWPASAPQDRAEAPQMKLEESVTGLTFPVQITHSDDGSGRIFVVEQVGRVRIIRPGPALDNGAAEAGNKTLFLDITDRVGCCWERGLFSIVFPPNYSTSRHFYLNYTNKEGNTVISRFTTSDDPDRADPDSEDIVLTIDQLDHLHNGGRMAFSPRDGYLYVGNGDGGAWYHNTGQDPNSLLGKMLRIDVESDVKPYGIPEGNPFTAVDGYRDEIWALGLRNPWGFAFDKKTGALFIPDVGNSRREEVNFQPASSSGGENYGWPMMEGSICFDHWPCSERAEGLIPPVAEYDHTQGCAVAGGVVYRGSAFPHLQGIFLYSDYCRGQIWGLKRPEPRSQDVWQSDLVLNAAFPVSSIGEDEEGNVYVASYADGVIYMLAER